MPMIRSSPGFCVFRSVQCPASKERPGSCCDATQLNSIYNKVYARKLGITRARRVCEKSSMVPSDGTLHTIEPRDMGIGGSLLQADRLGTAAGR